MTDVVRAAGLTGYLDLMQSLRCDPLPLLAACKLNKQSLANPDTYISYPALIELLELSAAATGCPDFGLRLSALQDDTILGALALALRNADNLRDACELAGQHIHFHSPSVSLTILPERDNELEIVTLSINLKHSVPNRQAMELSVGLFRNIMRMLSNDQLRPARVCFEHSPAAAPECYLRHFKLRPEFNAPFNGMAFPSTPFRRQLHGANERLLAIALRLLEDEAPGQHQPIELRLKEVLRRLMRSMPPSSTDAAAALQLHPCTMQRQLAKRGLSFEQVRDDVRKDMVMSYLCHRNIPLSHIAQLLGYSDQSVLTRSCKRWYGRTPAQIRRESGT